MAQISPDIERILSNIRSECLTGSTGTQPQMPTEFVHICDVIIDSIQTNLSQQSTNNENQLKSILQLFEICVESNVPKLNLLSIDLLKIYIRQISESQNDNIKEYTITRILKHCCQIFSKNGTLISLELLAFIIEIAATFGSNLTINHVVDIIELCHKQIKEYVLKDHQQVNISNNGKKSTSNRASTLKNFLFQPNKISSSDDKIFSAIYLTSGQVCHYFVKNRIIQQHRQHSSSNSDNENFSRRTSQDFIHLMLYLIKKLETKVSFFCDVAWDQLEKTGDNHLVAKENETKAEIFILIKTFNCFYLKCIHFILLTIPDAWKHMTNQLMEVIWKNLAPVLISILHPTSTISRTNFSNFKTNELIDMEKSQGFFGRGSEKLHLSLPNNPKDRSLNSLNYQERQYMYKISMELLRLFGLESSMRPLLEALFYRIFLLPPLNQRLDTLVYMQEIFKNPLLVMILISDPICLFGPSVSNSQYLDLFQIFMDAIKEANLSDDIVLNQLSLACLATILNTIKNIINDKAIVECDETKGDDSQPQTSASMKNSPIIKLICKYVERNRKIFDVTVQQNGAKQRQRSTSRLSKYNQQSTTDRHFNFSFIKDRIYGGHSGSIRLLSLNAANQKTEHQQESEKTNNSQQQQKRDGSHYDDLDYRQKLNALISSESTSTLDSIWCLNKITNLKIDDHANLKQIYVSYKNQNNRHSTFKSESFHMSFEDFGNVGIDRPDIDLSHNLRLTSSDSKLNLYEFLDDSSDSSVHGDVDDEQNDDNVSIKHSISSVFSDSDETISQINDDKNSSERELMDNNENFTNIFELPKRIHQTTNLSNLCFFERLLAKIFVRKLSKIIPEFANCRNLFAVDESIQSFASNFCKDLYINLNLLKCQMDSEPKLIDLEMDEVEEFKNYRHLFNNLYINADGIYLTTYLTMLLNLKLLYSNYYQNDSRQNIPISEKSFIDDIFNYHITIYLSQNFLAGIYQNVLSDNLFKTIYGEFGTDLNKLPLVKFLLDIDILDRNNPNAFKLSDYVRLEQVTQGHHRVTSPEHRSKPIYLLTRRFCVCFWDQILVCLRQALQKKFTFQNMIQLMDTYNVTYISSVCLIFNCENKHSLAQSKNTNISIQITLMLFDICDKIFFYNRMDTIYDLLYQYIIIRFANPNVDIGKNFHNLKKSFSSNDMVNTFDQSHSSLSCTQISALKTLLTSSTRIGSYYPRIWKHVLDLSKFVIDIENFTFRSSKSSLLSRARVSINTILKSNSMSFVGGTSGGGTSNGPGVGPDFDSNLHADHYQNLYYQNAFNNFPGINEAEYSNFEQQFDIILNEIRNKKMDLEPDSKELEQIIEYLSLLVSQIFENIPLKCNLSLLNSFICELCDYSRMQLVGLSEKCSTATNPVTFTIWSSQECKSLMLFRLVEVILRFVRNGRPLLHFMKIWPVVSSHLVYAATHKESNISKKAITSLHDIINAFLSSYSELDFFNFNESLFKPYEKLLRFEMCNSECQQELVLYSICEFVEGASKEIRSGWKSIFKALKGLRLSIDESSTSQQNPKFNCTHHLQILTDTFEAFLRTDNLHVLAYASVDFIPCIFHLIRNFSSKPIDKSMSEYQNEVFILFLKCLQKFSKILRSINELSEDSFVNFQVRIKTRTRLVDVEKVKDSLNKLDSEMNFDGLYLCSNQQTMSNVSLFQIWYKFLEEYAMTICASHLIFRPMLLEVYCTLIQNIIDMNDVNHEFSKYCFNHIYLPMMQCWLRESLINEQQPKHQIDELYIFLKSWLQIFNNNIIKFMLSTPLTTGGEQETSNHLMLKQTLLIYIECLNGEYHDLISILALSLIKHLLLSLYQVFNSTLWKIVIDYFKIGHQLTIHPLKSLMNSFLNLPIDLSSDLDHIKIMSIRNGTNQPSSPTSFNYVQKRAQQIFFIDSQHRPKCQQTTLSASSPNQYRDSYFHTIIVETSTGIQQSISYNEFISQIHNHLTLLQIISSLLTFNIKPDFTELVPFFYEDIDELRFDNDTNTPAIPLLKLQSTQYTELCFFLKQSFNYSMKFDSRPGLKYLLRHICHTNSVPNLYQISVLVWSVQFSVNFFICSHQEYRNEDSLSSLEELFVEIASIYIERNNQMTQRISRKSNIIYDAHHHQTTSSTIMQTVDHSSINNEQQPKTYQMLPSDKVAKLLDEYRRNKHKQTGLNIDNHHLSKFHPGGIGLHSIEGSTLDESQTNRQQRQDDDGNDFLEYDLDIFIRLWNDVIGKCIRLHIESKDLDTFCFMLIQYQQLIKIMIIHSQYDYRSQEDILNWIDKLSNHILSLKCTTSGLDKNM